MYEIKTILEEINQQMEKHKKECRKKTKNRKKKLRKE